MRTEPRATPSADDELSLPYCSVACCCAKRVGCSVRNPTSPPSAPCDAPELTLAPPNKSALIPRPANEPPAPATGTPSMLVPVCDASLPSICTPSPADVTPGRSPSASRSEPSRYRSASSCPTSRDARAGELVTETLPICCSALVRCSRTRTFDERFAVTSNSDERATTKPRLITIARYEPVATDSKRACPSASV